MGRMAEIIGISATLALILWVFMDSVVNLGLSTANPVFDMQNLSVMEFALRVTVVGAGTVALHLLSPSEF